MLNNEDSMCHFCGSQPHERIKPPPGAEADCEECGTYFQPALIVPMEKWIAEANRLRELEKQYGR